MTEKLVQLQDGDGNNLYFVKPPSLSKIIVSRLPNKTTYTNGDNLDLTGLIISTEDAEGGQQILSSGYTTSPSNGSSLTTNGNIQITVSYQGFSCSFNIAVEAAGPEIVSWSSGSDAQIVAMLEAHYNGDIDITDHWDIGDTRSVSLGAVASSGTGWSVGESQAAQTIELVLMDSTCTGFTITGTSNKPTFIVGMKNCLATNGYMNSTSSNSGGWNSCARRGWCNNGFYNALPATLKGIFKQFTWQTGVGGGASSGLTSSNDYFALPPGKAIFGSTTHYAQTDEDALYTQWTWYATSANRVKSVSGTSADWWECSPYSGFSYYFCFVYSDGSASGSYAYDVCGLSPFGCI